jgi:hypothetical protein
MYSFVPSSRDDTLRFLDIVKNYSEVFKISKENFDIVKLIDDFNQKFSSKVFKDVFCVYHYYLGNSPIYVGISTDGHRNRFKKQLSAIFIDRNLNRKSPSIPVHVSGNCREAFIEKIHNSGMNLNEISLRVLPVYKQKLGSDNYDFLIDLVNQYGFGMFEKMVMNNHYFNGSNSHLLNVKIPNKHENLLYTKSDSCFIRDILESRKTVTVEDFMV